MPLPPSELLSDLSLAQRNNDDLENLPQPPSELTNNLNSNDYYVNYQDETLPDEENSGYINASRLDEETQTAQIPQMRPNVDTRKESRISSFLDDSTESKKNLPIKTNQDSKTNLNDAIVAGLFKLKKTKPENAASQNFAENSFASEPTVSSILNMIRESSNNTNGENEDEDEDW